MLSVNELLDAVKSEIINFKSGNISLVGILFKCYEWNRISRSNWFHLGTLFLNYIKNEDVGIVPIEKTSSGQQRRSKKRRKSILCEIYKFMKQS